MCYAEISARVETRGSYPGALPLSGGGVFGAGLGYMSPRSSAAVLGLGLSCLDKFQLLLEVLELEISLLDDERFLVRGLCDLSLQRGYARRRRRR